MKSAKEIRKIMFSTKQKFNIELNKIEGEIVAAAKSGLNKVITTAPIEIAQDIRDELTLNGFTVTPSSTDHIQVCW